MSLMNQSWRLSWQAWFGLLGLGLALWLAITYAGLIMEIIWILFGAFLFSLAIRPLADVLARRRIPRGVTVLGVYVGLIGLLAVLGTLLVPIITAETALLRASGPSLLQTALSHLSVAPLVGNVIPSNSTLIQNVFQYVAKLGPTFLSTVAGAGESVLNLFVVLVLAYFLAADTTIGPGLLHNLIPARYQSQVSAMMGRARYRLTRWVWAQVAIAIYFALMFGPGLTLLGVPFALTIALIGGMLEIIPYLGGAVAVLLGVISALTVSPWLAVWVFLMYLILTEIQSHIIAPTFYGRAMHLHPAAVLVALLIGFKAGGIIGVFFAVPVAVVLLTLLQEIEAVSLTVPSETPAEDKEATLNMHRREEKVLFGKQA
jgi:predicted PurR-regulated permease PerM